MRKSSLFVYLMTLVTTGMLLMGGIKHANAALMTFNSSAPANNAATRIAWLTAIGISTPQHLIDFESGFEDGQNVHNDSSLFPRQLVIRDTNAAQAIIRTGSGVIGGSNPVGDFAVTHNEQQFLELDFSAVPMDYVAFQDIDQAGTSGTVTFTDGSTAGISFETTGAGGDSAEFFGMYRNDMPRIKKVELDASGDGRWGVDNVEYGIIPLPGAVWLLGSGLIGLVGLRRKFRKQTYIELSKEHG